jgi:hypothetical protein
MTKRLRFVSAATLFMILGVGGAGIANDGNNDRDSKREVVVTFTKWVTGVTTPPPQDQPAPTRFLMRGIVGGDLGPGAFVGEVLDHKLTTAGHVTVPINALDAVYEVQADETFEALIWGGQSSGRGLLEGVILNGWRTGARVRVDFRVIPRCEGNPAGPCFQGTIRILRDVHDSH